MTGIADRIALGTVQFGIDYGVSNPSGQVTLDDALGILDFARASGVDTLDTARNYGESETVIGQARDHDWHIFTKLPPVPAKILTDRQDVSRWVSETVDLSLTRLRRDRLAGLMLHHPAQLIEAGGQGLFDALRRQRDEGRTARIGISIYEPADLDVLPNSMVFDFVQGPLNLLDRRLAESGWLARLAEQGCGFFARSVFLQGLLLMPASTRPAKFERWQALWQAWDRYLAANGLTAIEACLRFVMTIPHLEKIVLGVTSGQQLSEVLAAASGDLPPLPDALNTADADLLNPSRWNLL